MDLILINISSNDGRLYFTILQFYTRKIKRLTSCTNKAVFSCNILPFATKLT